MALSQCLSLAIVLGVAGLSQAGSVVSYDAGVTPGAGTTGADDPTNQGWIQNTNLSNSFLTGLDSSLGGWRITDGTGSGFFFYSRAISAGDAAAMAANNWTANWTVALTADAISSAGVPNGVDNYFSSDPTRQNNNALWLEINGQFRYILTHRVDANGDLQLTDGTSTYQVTADGGHFSQELGSGAPIADYVTYTLSFDALGGSAALSDSLGNNFGVIATSGSATTDRVVWGSTSSAGQGSTIWNQVQVEVVPEPSAMAMALLGMGGLLVERRRRR